MTYDQTARRSQSAALNYDQVVRLTQAQLNRMDELLTERNMALAGLYLQTGRSHREIGEEYGMGETTVRNAVQRYRDKIVTEAATEPPVAV